MINIITCLNSPVELYWASRSDCTDMREAEAAYIRNNMQTVFQDEYHRKWKLTVLNINGEIRTCYARMYDINGVSEPIHENGSVVSHGFYITAICMSEVSRRWISVEALESTQEQYESINLREAISNCSRIRLRPRELYQNTKINRYASKYSRGVI